MRRRHLPVDEIIVHCSVTEDSGTVSWGAIRKYHVYTRGWDDIGYHAGIEETYGGLECFYGRPDMFIGAHCRGHNSTTLGFCFVGKFDTVPPSDELLEVAAFRVIIPWLLTHGLDAEAIKPHSAYSSKACPGCAFDIEGLREICRKVVL